MAPLRSTLTILACVSLALVGCESNAEGQGSPQKRMNDNSVITQDVTIKRVVNEQILKPFAAESGRLCGYKDPQGKVVVAPIYDTCGAMSDGMAYVGLFLDDMGEQYNIGYINHLGKVAIPLENKVDNDWKFDVRDFSEGLVAVSKNGKWGYINKAGKIVIDHTYDSAGDFDDGVAVAALTDQGFGLIDKTGKEVVAFSYADISEFSNGFAMAKDAKSNKYGVIDNKGKSYGDFAWDDAISFSEGLAAVAIGKGESFKWGFVDETGLTVIKPTYDMVSVDMGGDSIDNIGGLFQNGVVDVYEENPDSFTVITIDKTGKQLKKEVYDNMMSAFTN